jgi:hypothetical protein
MVTFLLVFIASSLEELINQFRPGMRCSCTRCARDCKGRNLQLASAHPAQAIGIVGASIRHVNKRRLPRRTVQRPFSPCLLDAFSAAPASPSPENAVSSRRNEIPEAR